MKKIKRQGLSRSVVMDRAGSPTPTDADHVTAILSERNNTHGDFGECAAVSQGILRVLSTGSRWNDLNDVQREAIQMISHKLHRIVCGDPNEQDHFLDIAGYATLVVKDLKKNKKS